MSEDRVAEAWLMSRVDAECTRTLHHLVDVLSQHLATAVGEAVAVRRLGADGVLRAVAAHHPDPSRAAAMEGVMRRTERADTGLWAAVVRDRVTVRWAAAAGDAGPSSEQSRFIDAHSVRAVIGVPLLAGEQVIGGVALVRFGVDRPFGDADEATLLAFAARLSVMVDSMAAFDPRG